MNYILRETMESIIIYSFGHAFALMSSAHVQLHTVGPVKENGRYAETTRFIVQTLLNWMTFPSAEYKKDRDSLHLTITAINRHRWLAFARVC